MKWLKRITISIVILVLLLFLGIFGYMKGDAGLDYDVPDPIPVVVPTFERKSINFSHNFVSAEHLPVMGAGIIDVDADGIPELWLGGGRDQNDALFKYENGQFVDVTEGSGFTDKNSTIQSYGPTTIDIDHDGDEDMIITRDDGVYLYLNQNGQFSSSKLDLKFDDKSTPIGVTCGDINGDGLVDLFVSTYLPKNKMEGQTIFLKEGYGSNSLLFANRGNLQFEDITDASGLRYTHNTFLGVFVDFDNDNLLDLAVAHDTGEPRIYKNLGGEKFRMMANPMTGKYGYPMGIAVGDYNNDGRADLFFSNTGSTMPTAILKGDLDLNKHEFYGKWLMMRNEGGFKFSERGEETQVADYEFSWGAIFEDFNLDGLQDLVVAENYIDLPLFKLAKAPCRFLLNTPDHKFIATGKASGVENRDYAISPLTTDFNNDGYPDLLYSNIGGQPAAFINHGGDHHYLKVRLSQSALAIGAKVELTKSNGQVMTDWVVASEGLGSDQSHTLVFGLGKDSGVTSVKVTHSNGQTTIIESPEINSTLIISDPVEEELEESKENN